MGNRPGAGVRTRAAKSFIRGFLDGLSGVADIILGKYEEPQLPLSYPTVADHWAEVGGYLRQAMGEYEDQAVHRRQGER